MELRPLRGRASLLASFFLSGGVSAQIACDSISIESVLYAPFGDGLLVSLHNGSSQVLSGPTLDVLNADGDTLASGVMDFFALVPGNTQLHQAHFSPQPPTPFSGTIRLHYAAQNGLVTCDLPVTNADLCPSESCIPLEVYAYQQGGPVETDLTWSVTDTDNIIQASGVLNMPGTGFGYTVAELCLPPGDYTMHMAQAVAAGTIIQVGMTQANFAYTDGTNTQLPIGGSVDHPFSFYALCVESAQGITTQEREAPTLIIDGRTLRLSMKDGSALGTWIIQEGIGRMARTITSNASSASLDLDGLASGVYILRSLETKNIWPAQRFILN